MTATSAVYLQSAVFLITDNKIKYGSVTAVKATCTEPFPWVKGLGVALTTHTHLAPRFKKSRAILLFPPVPSWQTIGRILHFHLLSVTNILKFLNFTFFLFFVSVSLFVTDYFSIKYQLIRFCSRDVLSCPLHKKIYVSII